MIALPPFTRPAKARIDGLPSQGAAGHACGRGGDQRLGRFSAVTLDGAG